MDDAAVASLADGDKDRMPVKSPKSPDGTALHEMDPSTGAAGQKGPGMPSEATTLCASVSSVHAVEKDPSGGGNNALVSSAGIVVAASSEIPRDKGKSEALDDTYSWRGGTPGLEFLLAAQVITSPFLCFDIASGVDSGFVF
jgi:hypothetical protein